MTRLEAILSGHGNIRWPRDVQKLKQYIPELVNLTDLRVQELYGMWSEDFWSAGWLKLDSWSVNEFAKYLREPVSGHDVGAP